MWSVDPRSKWIKTSVVAAGIAALGLAVPVSAATDVTPPTLSAPIKASFTVGGQLTAGNQGCWDDGDQTGNIWAYLPANFKWRGSDDSGSVRYTLIKNAPGDGEPYEVLSNSTRTSYSTPIGNDGNDCGGGNTTTANWVLQARDAAGNTTERNIYGGRHRLTQDNNLADRSYYAPRAQITYAGSWSLASCSCWSGSQVHKTTGSGASASIRFADLEDGYVWPGPTYPMHVGLIMHTGPDRGKFKVYLNGALQATVDTYANASKPRVMVWQTSVTDQQTNVIKIVNQATPGRTRIDLDAVVTN